MFPTGSGYCVRKRTRFPAPGTKEYWSWRTTPTSEESRAKLESSGYQIREAADGLEALNLWRINALKIDLLVTDIVLPGTLNGGELAARFKKERPELKVILISSHTVDQAERNPSRDSVLPKPFSLERLTETARNCLDTTQMAG